MRLICPNCDAQYEVPTEVVPTEGRDVQCSNCGQTWFQHHPDHMPPVPEPEPVAQAAPAPSAAPQPQQEEVTQPSAVAQRRKIDPQVADILRQEAEHEAQLRAQNATGLESQPDLGLEDMEDDADRRAREARERMARMRGEDPAEQINPAPAAVAARRDLLPDIEEINSTLRSTGDRQIAGESGAVVPPRKSGFRRGFMSVTLIAVILTALYIYAPIVAQTVPQVDPYLSAYVTWIDQARSWLDGQFLALAQWLDVVAAAQE